MTPFKAVIAAIAAPFKSQAVAAMGLPVRSFASEAQLQMKETAFPQASLFTPRLNGALRTSATPLPRGPVMAAKLPTQSIPSLEEYVTRSSKLRDLLKHFPDLVPAKTSSSAYVKTLATAFAREVNSVGAKQAAHKVTITETERFFAVHNCPAPTNSLKALMPQLLMEIHEQYSKGGIKPKSPRKR